MIETMSVREVATLLEVGLAYVIEIDARYFVCFNFLALNNHYRLLGSSYLQLRPAPVDYPIVRDYVRHKRDSVLWASNDMGLDSPWGRGCLTVNANYIIDRVFTP